MEGVFIGPDGKPDDRGFHEEMLGADDQDTWDVSLVAAFPAYADRDAFWYRLEATTAELERRAADASSGRDRAYHATYPEFVRYFRERPTITAHDLLLAAAFTYGWMPRILQIVPGEAEGALAAVQSARAGGGPTAATVAPVAAFLAGSLSGASKLLHFSAPDRYPIWDSRVARYLGARPAAKRAEAKLNQYLAYTRLCEELSRDSRAASICSRVRTVLGTDLSTLRALELVLYLGGVAGTESGRE